MLDHTSVLKSVFRIVCWHMKVVRLSIFLVECGKGWGGGGRDRHPVLTPPPRLV